MMQPYGLPTRLLDWTAKLWTAMYVAFAGDPGADAELWCYDRAAFIAASLSKQQAYSVYPLPVSMHDPSTAPPRRRDRRDEPAHTSHARAEGAALNVGRVLQPARPPARVRGPAPHDTYHSAMTAKYLNDHREISASRIFPDFEGLGRFLRWQLDSLLTTLL